MKLIVGLGNPGTKFELTRHNVGFEVVDLLCREIRAKKAKLREFSLLAEGRVEGEKLILAKPQTFMNSSGIAVSSLVRKYSITLEDLYVVYDDLDLDLGLLRVRRKGSAGGHKGMKSIINSLGSQNFPRLRIGIGKRPRQMDSIDYVLSKFSHQERQQIDMVEQMAVDALKVMIFKCIDSAMNEFNVRQQNEE